MFVVNPRRYLHRLPRQGSAAIHESGGESMRTPSLPYPPSQEMASDVTFRTTSIPASFQPGEQPDIVAPTPRPSQSPTWLNPSEMLESSLNSTPVANTANLKQEQDLPPLRFGRGERPDAEDEPESEDEFVPENGRSITLQEPTSAPSQHTSPTTLKQTQEASLQDQPQQPQQQHHHHHHHHHHHPQHHPHAPLSSQVQSQKQSNIPQRPPVSPSNPGNQPLSPPITKTAEINTGEIPFGTENGGDFSSQLGMFPQYRH